MTRPDLDSAIAPGATILIDTSVALAYLTGSEAVSPLADQLFDAFVATGRNPAAMSVVTVGEVLVRPFRVGAGAVATAEGFLRHFADIRLMEVDYSVARESARIRALTGLRTPDALIIATGATTGTDVLVTNDGSWPDAVASAVPALRVCLLRDHLA